MQKNRPAMNYDKLSRSLRYYYEKGIMQKVQKRSPATCVGVCSVASEGYMFSRLKLLKGPSSCMVSKLV